MAKRKRYDMSPEYIFSYMARMGVPKSVVQNVKAELISWAISQGNDIKASRIYTAVADVLWDLGWRQKRIVNFINSLAEHIMVGFDDGNSKPWERYEREVAEKTHLIFQDTENGMINMCEVSFDDEWEIKKEDDHGGD